MDCGKLCAVGGNLTQFGLKRLEKSFGLGEIRMENEGTPKRADGLLIGDLYLPQIWKFGANDFNG